MSEISKKAQLLDILEEMIKTYEGLPEHAKSSPVTHYDHISLLLILRELFKSEDRVIAIESPSTL